MSFNGSGVYTLYATGNPVVTGTTISSTWANNTLGDIATALSTCVLKDGTQIITANIPMATYKFTGVGAGTALTDTATLANIIGGTGTYVGTVGGTVDVITLTPSPAIAAYAAGQRWRWIASGTNTTNVTVAISGLAARALTKYGNIALIAGDIQSGAIVDAIDDGSRLQIIGITSYRATYGTNLSGGTAGTIPYQSAANTTAMLAAGATTEILVGGGAAAPVWTTATGSGAPVRATAPALGTPTSLTLTNATGLPTAGTSFTNTTRLLGRTTAGAGAGEEITVGTGLSLSALVLANTLTPGWTLLSTITANNSATADIETTFDATYDVYKIVAVGITSIDAAPELYCRFKVGGAYDTGGNYFYHTITSTPTAATYAALASGGDVKIDMGALAYATTVGANASFEMTIVTPTSTVFKKTIRWNGVSLYGYPVHSDGTGGTTAQTALTGVRFYASTGNLAAGTFRLYGLRNS